MINIISIEKVDLQLLWNSLIRLPLVPHYKSKCTITLKNTIVTKLPEAIFSTVSQLMINNI